MKKVLLVFVIGLLGIGLSYGQYGKNSWMFSGSGFADLGGFNIETKYPAPVGTREINMIATDFVISSRNAYFVIPNLGIGVDIQVDIAGDAWEPEGNFKDNMTYDYNGTTLPVKDYVQGQGATTMFFGPFIRYYIPIGKVVAIFPEGSIGYRMVGDITYIEGKVTFPNGTSEEKFENIFTTRVGGLGYNMGLGCAFRLSPHFALDATCRWGGGNIKGNTEDKSDYPSSAGYVKVPNYDVTVKYAAIQILIGFQIYIGG